MHLPRYVAGRFARDVLNHLQRHHPIVTRVSAGIDIAVGAAAVVLAALGASAIPAADGWWRLVVVGAVVAVFAAVTADARAAAAVVVLAWLVVNGFLVDRYGQLAWHGDPDLVRLLVLAVCAGLGVLLSPARTPSPARKE